jgi:hypothetical protein
MYTLEAILAQKAIIEDAVEDFLNAKLIQLPQDIYMIPMVGTLLQELEIRYQGGTKVTDPDWQQFSESLFHPTFERLIVGVDQFARHLSRNGLVAYVEATFTGGYGGHATMLWEYGKRLDPPGNNINIILKRLGVVCSSRHDEFDTVGLGRYRSTKRWFEASSSDRKIVSWLRSGLHLFGRLMSK